MAARRRSNASPNQINIEEPNKINDAFNKRAEVKGEPEVPVGPSPRAVASHPGGSPEVAVAAATGGGWRRERDED
ncbi:hypothetical protein chiPu_0022681 [Chiloscyllium punctatum]|uniref:Uncharacterized protein n=1 Tax=Chiloscyllium punctatum TaxID=137246 RepID=A0A401T8B3_CHIPU|nr:hypothetical protein [Chiloscyllium punctatum]